MTAASLGCCIVAFFLVLPLGGHAQASSLIPPTEMESVLPVTVYTAEVLQKQGANTPIEGLRQLPIFVGTTTTENNSNGGDGSAFINLYALGSNNVLTLINGRRAFNFSDINAISIGTLSRAEILKGWGAINYGSNAAAGVVNVILLNGPGEQPYEGAELHALYGNTTDSDAHVRQVYVRGGVTGLDGKVSIAAAGEYYSRANLFSRDRNISATGDLRNNPTGQGWGGLNNNSPTFAGRVTIATPVGATPAGSLVLINLSENQVTPASYRRFDSPAGSDPSRFNFRNFTPAIPAVEKAMYFVTGRYKIFGDSLQLYGDVMYSKTKQDNALAGAPFAITSPFNGRDEVRASQFNPFGNNLAALSYRLQQELGNRRSFYDHDYWRYVAGINGDFNIKDNSFISRFGYDSGFVYESFQEQRIDSGDGTRSGIRQAIAGLDTDLDGVADLFFNPFIGINAPVAGTAPTYVGGVATGLTAAYDNVRAAQFASYIGHSFFYERDFLYDAKAYAHLFPNLWNGGIDLALGYEHREIHSHSVPDPVQATGDQLGFNRTPNTKFTREVDSFFTELSVPLITSTMNISFVRSLEFSFAWRYEKFDDRDDYFKTTASFDNNGTPQLGLRYQPFSDLLLRASWRQSIRAPTPNELFAPVFQTFPPFLGGGIIPPPLPIFAGGNPALGPETTDAYSAGIVWNPTFIPGFTLTMDWYQLFTEDLILDGEDFWPLALPVNANTVGGPPFNNGAFTDPDGCGGGSGAAEAPGGPGVGITRDPVTGAVLCIDSLNSNAGKRLVQGIDVTAVYEIPTERFGKFTFSGGYNHFFTWKAEPLAGAGTHNFLGDYNNGTFPFAPGAIPFNKGFLRGEWEWRHFDFVMTGNYIGDYEDVPQFILGNTQIGGTDVEPTFALHRRVTSYITLDLQLSYEFVKPQAEPPTYSKDAKDSGKIISTRTDSSSGSTWQRLLWGTKVTVGVNNAFDRNPPSVLAALNDNYDTSLYSIRNRYYYIAFNKKF